MGGKILVALGARLQYLRQIALRLQGGVPIGYDQSHCQRFVPVSVSGSLLHTHDKEVLYSLTSRMHSSLLGCITLSARGLQATCVLL